MKRILLSIFSAKFRTLSPSKSFGGLLLIVALALGACKDEKPIEINLQGWVDVSIDYWHYTPHTVFILVNDPSLKIQRADSIRVINLTDDTTYFASEPLRHYEKMQYGFEFEFPNEYIVTYFYGKEVILSASLYFP